MAHPTRPVLDRRAGAARRARPPWERAYDRHPHLVPRRGRLPRSPDDGGGRGRGSTASSAPTGRRRARPARGRRVRPPRALRRARAVGQPLRPRLGGRAPHLAAVRAQRQEQSGLGERESVHLRRQYGAKLSMIDHWLGRHPRRRRPSTTHGTPPPSSSAPTTATTWASAGFWGKPQVPVHPELGHIPLLIAWPGVAPTTNDALTTTVDLHATLCDVFGVTPQHRTHGQSLVPLLEGDGAVASGSGRCAGCGVGRCTWPMPPAPSPAPRSRATGPLSMFSNRWSTMPIRALPASACPGPTIGRGSIALPGQRRARHPPALRSERRPPVLGARPLRRRRPLRPTRGRRHRRAPQPGRRQSGRRRDARTPRRGPPLDRGARGAAGPPRPVVMPARASLRSERPPQVPPGDRRSRLASEPCSARTG